jgi:hypothetical protein
MSTEATAILVSAVVSVFLYFLASRRTDSLRRIELTIQQLDRQVSELYGPVSNLICQVHATWDVKQTIKPFVTPDEFAEIDHRFGCEYFGNLHARIRKILREKGHLAEGGKIPESFYDYMKHCTMEHIQLDLMDKKKIDTTKAKPYRWPSQFDVDVQTGLEKTLRERQKMLNKLQPRRFLMRSIRPDATMTAERGQTSGDD